MLFSSNLPLWFCCSCSYTAWAHSRQATKDQCSQAPQLPASKHSSGSRSSPEDTRQFANSSPPCVYHETEFWLFFPDQEISLSSWWLPHHPRHRNRDSCTRQALRKGCCDFRNEEMCPLLPISNPTPTWHLWYNTVSLHLAHPFSKTWLITFWASQSPWLICSAINSPALLLAPSLQPSEWPEEQKERQRDWVDDDTVL